MSCSEYLGRQKQRMTQILDVRPHRDAGHQTEIIRRLAASGNFETAVVPPACTTTLNMTAVMPASQFYSGGGHQVRDAAHRTEYIGGQAVAMSSSARNAKVGPQLVREGCMTNATLPEINDKLAADANLSRIQAEKNARARGYATCCQTCKKVVFANTCSCANVLPLANASGVGFKNTYIRPRVVE
jgi:hypothetical protein